jgi:hypothetical protein
MPQCIPTQHNNFLKTRLGWGHSTSGRELAQVWGQLPIPEKKRMNNKEIKNV